jgi:hypothetical protein
MLACPEPYSMGALVGLRGLDVVHQQDGLWALPAGDKGTVVSASGETARSHDLYAAHKRWRRIYEGR